MKRCLDLIRTIVVSFEFVVILLWSIALIGQISLPASISANDMLTDEKIKWLALVPAGLMAVIFKDSSSLLFPNKDEQNLITGFADFWVLRNMLSATLFYSVVFAALGVFGWTLDATKDASRLIFTLGAALIGSGINYFTFHNAISTINIIFASKGKTS